MSTANVPRSLIRDFIPRHAREGADLEDLEGVFIAAKADAMAYMQTEPFWRSVWSSDDVDVARSTWTSPSPSTDRPRRHPERRITP